MPFPIETTTEYIKVMRTNNKNLGNGPIVEGSQPAKRVCSSDASGFSLIEVAVAMVVIMVALMGVFFTFTYAITYNAGNKSRAQALAILQQEVEQLRSAKFTPTITDPILEGGAQAVRIRTHPNGGVFGVTIVVDNDPTTTAIENETVPTAVKEITVSVSLERPSPGWQAAVPATVILRRVRGN